MFLGRDRLKNLESKRSAKGAETRQHFEKLKDQKVSNSCEENLVSKNEEFCL